MKSVHGGKRPGAGRPKGEETRVLSTRVPARLYDEIRAAVIKLVTKMSKRPTQQPPESKESR